LLVDLVLLPLHCLSNWPWGPSVHNISTIQLTLVNMWIFLNIWHVS